MNPLHTPYLATDRIAELRRQAAASHAIGRRDVREPAPEPWPLPPFPRLAVGRLVARLRQALTHAPA